MEIPIQSPWFRRALFPAFFPVRIFDLHPWDQWDGEFFTPFHSLFYYQPYVWRHLSWWDTVMSEVGMDKDRFVINLEVKHFNPDELSVKASDDEYEHTRGKRKEQKDENGYVASEFSGMRICRIPLNGTFPTPQRRRILHQSEH